MNDIAIIGIGCLFPEAQNPDQFWDILMNGRDVTSELTAADLGGKNPALFRDPILGTPDKISYSKNGYLRGFQFDAGGYQLPAEKLQKLDRLHHFCLYGAKEALRDSGYWQKPAILAETGLILGNLSFATETSSRLFGAMHRQSLGFFLKQLLHRPDFSFPETSENLSIDPDNALTASGPSDIVSRGLGLGGRHYTIDAACATSLYVMALASHYLRSGQAKMMLAGAVCSPERLHVLHGFNVLHAFPGSGQSRPLDQSSEGIKIGEGAGVFVLKRVEDAERDGDRIYAVIENIGLSNDGAGKHILSPAQKGQYLALERAYGSQPLADYIECHATGTPLGDKTELNTLEAFCQAKKALPRLGANKIHLGHLLTASGMVSLIKGIGAINRGMIPPTAGIERGMSAEQGLITPAAFVTRPTPWPTRAKPKRVGINAFGFGGTNAHLILKEYQPQTAIKVAVAPQKPDTLAMVGMALHIGSVEGLEAFQTAIEQQRPLQQSLPPYRWLGAEESLDELPPPGAYLEKFDLDCLQYKVPPNQVSSLLFDHLLMLKIADQALRDAGLQKGGSDSDTAVIVAMEMNLAAHRSITRLSMPWYLRESIEKFNLQLSEEQVNSLESLLKDCISPNFYLEGITGGIGNLAASRIASLWDFTGPAFTLSAQEGSVAKAIEVAQFLLNTGQVKAVVIGCLDQSGGWEQVQWRKSSHRNDRSADVGEGAAAIVLMNTEQAHQQQRRIYATIDGMAVVDNHRPQQNQATTTAAAQAAVAKAGIDRQAVSYLQVNYLATPETQGSLTQFYALPSTSVDSLCSQIGNTQVLASLASLIKTGLGLYHRYLPHYAAIHTTSHDGTNAHFILRQADRAAVREQSPSPLTNPVAKQLLKTIYSGSLRMGNVLLTGDNLQEFRQHSHPEREVLPAMVWTSSHVLARKQTIFQQQAVVNAKLEQLLLAVQSAFYQDIDRQFTPSGSVILPVAEKQLSRPLVWNTAELLEINEGKISRILGEDYQSLDDCLIRTRTPSPPFMFVSRVTQMTAKKGVLEPCYIEWEYDIPADTFFAAHGVLTGIIPFEASHVMLLALAYMGCDLIFNGQLRYRALDSEVRILGELPSAGETIRGEVFINKLIKTNKNLILQYVYNCYRNEQQILTISANSGYFSPTDLQQAKGLPEFKPAASELTNIKLIQPPLLCAKTSFNSADIQALQAGKFEDCFGETYRLSYPRNQLLCSHQLLMLSRIVKVDKEGGAWELGQIIGELDINPDHWVFQAHFKNDPVMPGTMLVEGCNQVALFYLYYLGLQSKFKQFKPTWVANGVKSKAKFRGEVKPYHDRVQFRVTVKEMQEQGEPYMITVAEILLKGNVIGICENLSVKLLDDLV